MAAPAAPREREREKGRSIHRRPTVERVVPHTHTHAHTHQTHTHRRTHAEIKSKLYPHPLTHPPIHPPNQNDARKKKKGHFHPKEMRSWCDSLSNRIPIVLIRISLITLRVGSRNELSSHLFGLPFGSSIGIRLIWQPWQPDRFAALDWVFVWLSRFSLDGMAEAGPRNRNRSRAKRSLEISCLCYETTTPDLRVCHTNHLGPS